MEPRATGPRAMATRAGARATSINAAALQDHFARTLKLDAQLRRGLKAPRIRQQASLRRAEDDEDAGGDELSELERLVLQRHRPHGGGGKRGGKVRASSRGRRGEKPDQAKPAEAAAESEPWTCERCTLFNADGPERCHACGSLRRAQLREIARKAPAERATLAQRLGIVQGPPVKLSEVEWKRLEQQSEGRKDSFQPCAICRQDFGTDEQLMLSCSHVFHKACLDSFERFVRSKERCCPLCRKADYEKRTVGHGAKAHRERSATRIQAALRGWWARKAFAQLLGAHYGAGRGDPRLRRRFFATKLTRCSDRLMRSISAREDSLERLFRDLDASLCESRRVFGTKHAAGLPSRQDWAKLLVKVQEREQGDAECAICMAQLDLRGAVLDLPTTEAPETSGERRVVLLSCSHVFHDACISAFERFAIERAARCPMCREQYAAKAPLLPPPVLKD